ncbi:MAG: hypothetical protein LBM68_02970 [Bacteroidales bacterium]|jgi:DNA primase|nr:hypothetical protein [Bacteroidales bacterium]
MINNQLIDSVKNAADIVDVVGDYVNLKRTGSSWTGFCPFHDNKKTPAFSVNPAKNYCKCFSCMDTTMDVIDFVAKIEHISKGDAIRRLAERYHIPIDNKPRPKAKPNFTKVQYQDTFSYKKKEFSADELKLLGKNITAEICENEFNLHCVESFIRPGKNNSESWEISSTPEFPIFVFDYGDWGRIYQPNSKDNRFSFFGDKPQESVQGNAKAVKMYKQATEGKAPEEDDRLEELIICSGGSDALNIFANTHYNVLFLNSETADITQYMYRMLKRIAKTIYLCYDTDVTGIRQAQKYALAYLDFHIINLPADLNKFRDRKGAPCKDAKDFFMHYRSKKYQKNDYLFKQLVRTSNPLRFWNANVFDKKGNDEAIVKYEINNEQMYQFLNACGLYTYDNPQNKEGFDFIQIDDKIVYNIKDKSVQSHANSILVDFIKQNLEYYNISLINAIHRSAQAKQSSLEKIRRIELDYTTYSRSHDYLFFKNTAVRINAEGFEVKQFNEDGKFIHDFDIIDHNFHKEPELFRIDYSGSYRRLQQEITQLHPDSYEYKEKAQQLNIMPDTDKYDLTIYNKDFSFLQYLYNTGRFYWRKEKEGAALSIEEKREEDLFFISKVCALGYLMYRYKEASKGLMVYAIETELDTNNAHKGGTGKTIFFDSLNYVRPYIKMGNDEIEEKKNFYSRVELGKTKIVYFDDLNDKTDLEFFKSTITGDMTVEAKYMNRVSIPASESPKLCASSNFAPTNFSGPLKRRFWFTGFCDYYHGSDDMRGLKDFSPNSEFGKDLLIDYTEKEMNEFYNFMAQCLHTYLKFREKINPPMDMIEQRILRRELSEEFIFWAEDYFQPDKLNCNVDVEEIFTAYKASLPEQYAKHAKKSKLKNKLITFCRYKKWLFNPPHLLLTETEKSRNVIRGYSNGTDIYYYYIEAQEEQLKEKFDFNQQVF